MEETAYEDVETFLRDCLADGTPAGANILKAKPRGRWRFGKLAGGSGALPSEVDPGCRRGPGTDG